MSDQDTDGNSSYVVLRMRPETCVYLNKHDDVVICQTQWPEDDVFVYIEQRDVPAIIAKLIELTTGNDKQ